MFDVRAPIRHTNKAHIRETQNDHEERVCCLGFGRRAGTEPTVTGGGAAEASIGSDTASAADLEWQAEGSTTWTKVNGGAVTIAAGRSFFTSLRINLD